MAVPYAPDLILWDNLCQSAGFNVAQSIATSARPSDVPASRFKQRLTTRASLLTKRNGACHFNSKPLCSGGHRRRKKGICSESLNFQHFVQLLNYLTQPKGLLEFLLPSGSDLGRFSIENVGTPHSSVMDS